MTFRLVAGPARNADRRSPVANEAERTGGAIGTALGARTFLFLWVAKAVDQCADSTMKPFLAGRDMDGRAKGMVAVASREDARHLAPNPARSKPCWH